MTRADRVHSTPPTNTSALPVETTRRHLLAIATVGADAAAMPAAALADAPKIDQIYAAIDAHRQAVAADDAVTDVRAAFNDVNMSDEQKAQLAVLEAAVDDARDELDDVGCDLVNSKAHHTRRCSGHLQTR